MKMSANIMSPPPTLQHFSTTELQFPPGDDLDVLLRVTSDRSRRRSPSPSRIIVNFENYESARVLGSEKVVIDEKESVISDKPTVTDVLSNKDSYSLDQERSISGSYGLLTSTFESSTIIEEKKSRVEIISSGSRDTSCIQSPRTLMSESSSKPNRASSTGNLDYANVLTTGGLLIPSPSTLSSPIFLPSFWDIDSTNMYNDVVGLLPKVLSSMKQRNSSIPETLQQSSTDGLPLNAIMACLSSDFVRSISGYPSHLFPNNSDLHVFALTSALSVYAQSLLGTDDRHRLVSQIHSRLCDWVKDLLQFQAIFKNNGDIAARNPSVNDYTGPSLFWHVSVKDGRRQIIHESFNRCVDSIPEEYDMTTFKPVIYVREGLLVSKFRKIIAEQGLDPGHCVISIPLCGTTVEFGTNRICTDIDSVDVANFSLMIREDIDKGMWPWMIVGLVGCDDVHSLSIIAKEFGMWFHLEGDSIGLLTIPPQYSTSSSLVCVTTSSFVGAVVSADSWLVDSSSLLRLSKETSPPFVMFRKKIYGERHDKVLKGSKISLLKALYPVWPQVLLFGMQTIRENIQRPASISSLLVRRLGECPYIRLRDEILGVSTLSSPPSALLFYPAVGCSTMKRANAAANFLWDSLFDHELLKRNSILRRLQRVEWRDERGVDIHNLYAYLNGTKLEQWKQHVEVDPRYDNTGSSISKTDAVILRDMSKLSQSSSASDLRYREIDDKLESLWIVCFRFDTLLFSCRDDDLSIEDVQVFCSVVEELCVSLYSVQTFQSLFRECIQVTDILCIVDVSEDDRASLGLGVVCLSPKMQSLIGAVGCSESQIIQELVNQIGTKVYKNMYCLTSKDGKMCVFADTSCVEMTAELCVNIADTLIQETRNVIAAFEKMADLGNVVQLRIREAQQLVEDSKTDVLWQEGVLRKIPMVGNVYNWLLPVEKQIPIGMTFNLETNSLHASTATSLSASDRSRAEMF